MKRIAFYPIRMISNEYTNRIRRILETETEVIDYRTLREGKISIEDVDVIYLNWIEESLDDIDKDILTKAKGQGRKIIWVFHNRLPHEAEDIETPKNRIKWITGIADTIIIHSSRSEKYLQEYVGDSIKNKVQYIPHINYCGVYGYEFPDIRKKLEMGEGEILFAFFGQIRPYKNIEVLIQAFQEAELNNAKLLIVGRANSDSYFESLLASTNGSSQIIMMNTFINNNIMGAFLEATDVVVLPYSLRSSMNSGAAIMSFSYSRTIIISDIAMADDFPQNLIYCYNYSDDVEHKDNLKRELICAASAGREKLHSQGEKLLENINITASDSVVKDKLLSMMNISVTKSEDRTVIKNWNMDRMDYLFDTTFKWLLLGKKGYSVARYLKSISVNAVSIYGYGKLGHLLKDELEKEEIRVLYIVDKRYSELSVDVPLYSPYEVLPETNLIIITVSDYENVRRYIRVSEKCKKMWLRDLIECSEISL